MHQALRISRIRAPRGTPAAAVLLALVFIAIGLVISTLMPDQTASAPLHLEGTALTFSNWLLDL